MRKCQYFDHVVIARRLQQNSWWTKDEWRERGRRKPEEIVDRKRHDNWGDGPGFLVLCYNWQGSTPMPGNVYLSKSTQITLYKIIVDNIHNNYIIIREWENAKRNDINSKKGRETPTKTKFDRYRWSHPRHLPIINKSIITQKQTILSTKTCVINTIIILLYNVI